MKHCVPDLTCLRGQKGQWKWTMVFSICMRLMCIGALITTAEDPKRDSQPPPVAFVVRGPMESVVEKGQDAVLKYQLDPPITTEHMEIQCYLSESGTVPENVCLAEKALNSIMTKLSTNSRIYLQKKDDIRKGSVELHVDGVQLSDEGTYVCCFKAHSWAAISVTHLYVAAIGSGPDTEISKTPAGGIHLFCFTSGWYPKPEMWWGGSSGGENLISDLPPESITVSRTGNYTCHVKNQHLNRTKTVTVSVQDSILQNDSCYLPWILACIFIIIVIGLIFLCYNAKKRNCIEAIRRWFVATNSKEPKEQVMEEGELLHGTEKAEPLILQDDPDSENQNHQNERKSLIQKYGPAPFTEVTVILENSDNNYLDIRDQKSVKLKGDAMPDATVTGRQPVIFGKDGFDKGKHFWKVYVGQANWWAVGVAEELARTVTSNLLENEGVWAVGLTAGQYQAFTSPLTNLSLDPLPKTLLVYLDIEGGQLSFYNADNQRHIYSYMTGFREVFPFIWTMDKNNWITVGDID